MNKKLLLILVFYILLGLPGVFVFFVLKSFFLALLVGVIMGIVASKNHWRKKFLEKFDEPTNNS